MMLTFHLYKQDLQMVLFKFSEENQNKDNSKLLLKQCQNVFTAVSGATMMLTFHLYQQDLQMVLFQFNERIQLTTLY